MQLLYEGTNISSSVNIAAASITDNAGSQADEIKIYFNDPEGLWGKWKPEKNHTLQMIQNGFDSGLMWIHELGQVRGKFFIRAFSMPAEVRTDRVKAWENIRFLVLANEIASKYNFALQTYGIENQLYKALDMQYLADFEFLSWRCMLEGYMLKLCDKKAVIYSQNYMESQPAARTLSRQDFDGDYIFKTTSDKIYGSCLVTYGDIKGEFSKGSGPTLKITDLQVFSQGEAERYAKNILRDCNKKESTGFCTIAFDSGLAAGNCIQVSDIGFSDGKYFCEQVIHKFGQSDKGKTELKLRKVLEGY